MSVLAGVALMESIYFQRGQYISKNANRAILMMGLFCALWCMAFAVMFLTANRFFVDTAWVLAIAGIFGYMTTVICLISFSSGLVTEPRRSRNFCIGLASVSAGLALWLAASSHVRTDYFTFGTYYHESRLVVAVCTVYIAALLIAGMIMLFYWRKTTPVTRDKKIAGIVLGSGTLLISFSLIDVILPLEGIQPMRISPAAAFVAYMMLCTLCKRYNTFSISSENQAKYIYEIVDTPIIVLDHSGNVSMVNAYGRKYFNINGTGEGITLSELFHIGGKEGEKLIESIIASGGGTRRMVSKNSGSVCATHFTVIRDEFDEISCIYCIAYDMTREANALAELRKLRDELEVELKKRSSQMEHVTLNAITTVANTIDAKDEYTKGHSVRVARYASEIAKEMGYPADMVQNIKYIGLLHDIGKIGVPDTILNKPGKLSDVEYDMIKTHTDLGGEILKDIAMVDKAAEGARFHHERYDGKGYPIGLSGEDIPIEARIIEVADAYDAMTSDRIYRKRLSPEQVHSELEKGRGTQFDPKIVDALFRLIDSGRLGVSRSSESLEDDEAEADESNQMLQQIMDNWDKTVRLSSSRDYLTGLRDRRTAEKLIGDALNDDCGCLGLIDLDNLKRVNDIFGHLAGDYVLKMLGEVLSSQDRKVITARYGGDEFLLFIPTVSDKETVATVIDSIMEAFNYKKQEGEQYKLTSLSIGLCMCPKGGDLTVAIANADKALYNTKLNGKNNYSFYMPSSVENGRAKGTDLKRLVDALQQQGGYIGALSVEYREFSKLYSYISNMGERNSYPVHLIMLTLESDAESNMDIEKQEKMMYYVEAAVCESLRKTDVCTRFSSIQYLVVLANATPESINTIINRIIRSFYKMCGSNTEHLTYDVAHLDNPEIRKEN